MNIIKKIKFMFYNIKLKKCYKKFNNCSIPYPFFDKKRDTLEWVKYNDRIKEYEVNNSLLYALGDNMDYGLIYHYQAKIYGRENANQEMKYRMMVSHCHSFDEVIDKLYHYPETFQIPKEYINEYSEQELKYLKQLQNYLHLIELKDYRSSEDEADITRYENEKAKEYAMMKPKWFDNIKIAESIINGNKDYIINVQHSFSSNKLNEKWLIIANNTYLGIIEIVKEDIIKFKYLHEDMVDYKLVGFKNFKDYKKELFNSLKKDCSIVNESFTEESLIKYLKVKVIKKL